MEHNLGAIRQRVIFDKMDEEDLDPGLVDRFINDTQRDIFNEFELSFMEKIFLGTVPAGTTMFKMPKDVALVQSRTISGGDQSARSLKPGKMAFRDFNRQFPVPEANKPGPIYNWTLYANNMLTSAPTDQDYLLKMFYYKKPTTLTENTSEPDIPEEFQEVLVLGAYIRLLERNEDFDLAERVRVQYNRILLQMVDRYGGRDAEGTQVMRNSYGAGGAGFNTTRNGLVRKSY